ncbi:MAG TPA: type II toxin-antitoxin system RelE/ParE family toxin [Candidatus Saccharimonadales bacterium]|nr:type II toxin-antitoxin system RelE/ParE family toxin [Candidatus Saccharimonadales bacterium]
MVSYKIILSKQVRKKDFPKLPKNVRIKVVAVIGSLAGNPKPSSAMKLTNREEYKIRQGKCRILYVVWDEKRIIEVRRVMLRGEDYKP